MKKGVRRRMGEVGATRGGRTPRPAPTDPAVTSNGPNSAARITTARAAGITVKEQLAREQRSAVVRNTIEAYLEHGDTWKGDVGKHWLDLIKKFSKPEKARLDAAIAAKAAGLDWDVDIEDAA